MSKCHIDGNHMSRLIHVCVCFRLEEEEDPRHTRMCKAFTLGVAYAAITGGIATMTGAIPNLVFIGVLEA